MKNYVYLNNTAGCVVHIMNNVQTYKCVLSKHNQIRNYLKSLSSQY